ncbi:hypothetical protein ELS19_10335 [Halogeometricum borinquense]|uniref:Uncharacterized protein n=1 Tax=Halogeometricum borinquense TaxID=60847 RepID=A0A482TJZ6_9EURY|nr:hypothetical protein [Halogeometricum borinquense]RYJ14313.1 hypothetical protein ELS19_10335 [Halogeometricum borinquense]
MVPPSPSPLAETLQARLDCLRTINDDPQEKRTLTDSLDIPRSTLDDIVRELEEKGLVSYRDGEWHTTPWGQLACEMHYSYLNSIRDLIKAKPVLDILPPNHSLSESVIVDAEVKLPHPNVSGCLMGTILERLEKANDIRIATPQVLTGYYEQFYQYCSNGETSVEIILDQQIRDWYESQDSEKVNELSNCPSTSVRWREIPFEFGLVLLDDEEVIVSVFAEHGIAGLIMNDSRDAMAWARDRYDSIRQDSESTKNSNKISGVT